MKQVTTKLWSLWYPVPADREPRYTEVDFSEGGTHYKMLDPVAEDQRMYLDFIETSCEKAQLILDKALKGLDQQHEIYYSLQKKGICALLRFHADDAARTAIDIRVADETFRLVGYFSEPL
ncbi:MAG: hypothetical protein NT027_19165 [Proteobacteria bacterium]|nr:hypothetical protein [Pseudomonadota bacterium]